MQNCLADITRFKTIFGGGHCLGVGVDVGFGVSVSLGLRRFIEL